MEKNLNTKIDKIIEKKVKAYIKKLKIKIPQWDSNTKSGNMLLHEHTLQCLIYHDIIGILDKIKTRSKHHNNYIKSYIRVFSKCPVYIKKSNKKCIHPDLVVAKLGNLDSSEGKYNKLQNCIEKLFFVMEIKFTHKFNEKNEREDKRRLKDIRNYCSTKTDKIKVKYAYLIYSCDENEKKPKIIPIS